MQKLILVVIVNVCFLFIFSCKNEVPQMEESNLVFEQTEEELESLGIATKTSTNLKKLTLGDTAPDFISNDLEGKRISLSEMTKDGSAILVFYRGHWCGYCTKYLSELQSHAADLATKGVSIIAVSPETKAYNLETSNKHELSIPILSDSDNSIMNNYGVAFDVNQMYQDKIVKFKEAKLTDFSGNEEAVLPIPATFVIGKDRVIKYVHYDPNYRERAPLDEIFKHL